MNKEELEKEAEEKTAQYMSEGVSWQPLRYKGAWIENADNYAQATKAFESRRISYRG